MAFNFPNYNYGNFFAKVESNPTIAQGGGRLDERLTYAELNQYASTATGSNKVVADELVKNFVNIAQYGAILKGPNRTPFDGQISYEQAAAFEKNPEVALQKTYAAFGRTVDAIKPADDAQALTDGANVSSYRHYNDGSETWSSTDNSALFFRLDDKLYQTSTVNGAKQLSADNGATWEAYGTTPDPDAGLIDGKEAIRADAAPLNTAFADPNPSVADTIKTIKTLSPGATGSDKTVVSFTDVKSAITQIEAKYNNTQSTDTDTLDGLKTQYNQLLFLRKSFKVINDADNFGGTINEAKINAYITANPDLNV